LWKDIWKVALKHQICPFGRCDLSARACEHLNKFSGYDSSERAIKPQVLFIDDIEERPNVEPQEPGKVWELFKKLRKFGMKNDQIGILIRKFGYDMTRREILEDMGYTSNKMFEIRYNRAIDELRKRGFR
jgi:hypothetical protein